MSDWSGALAIYLLLGNRLTMKIFLNAFIGAALCVGSAYAEVVIKLRPPISIHEHRTARPSRDHVWVGGYHRYEGGSYHWEAGRWEQPPRVHAVWIAPRYTHRHDGYVYTEGYWR
jgi:hypothetical protein